MFYLKFKLVIYLCRFDDNKNGKLFVSGQYIDFQNFCCNSVCAITKINLDVNLLLMLNKQIRDQKLNCNGC